MGERGTQGTVDNDPCSKTHPPVVPSLTAPATDGTLEGVSENVAEDIINIIQDENQLNIIMYSSYTTTCLQKRLFKGWVYYWDITLLVSHAPPTSLPGS